MSQPIVAAVQMTSLADVAQNLATARRLLGDRARSRRLPRRAAREFLVHGQERGGAARGRRARRRRARCSRRWRRSRASSGSGSSPARSRSRSPGDSRPANACVVYDAQGKRAARYDKIHLFDVDLPGGREGYRESANARAGREAGARRHARGPARADRVLRFALPRAVPATRFGGSRDLQRAVRIHEPDRARALGNAAARARHRGPLLRDRGRAERHPRQQPRDLRRHA